MAEANRKPPIRWHVPTLLVAAALAVAGIVAGIVHVRRDNTGPFISTALPREAAPVANAIRDSISAEDRLVRFKRTEVATSKEAIAALDAGKVEAALTRSDIAMPRSGGTAVIIRRDALVLITQRRSKVTNAAALAGKTVAVVDALGGSDRALVDSVLRFYEIEGKVTLVNMTLAELPAAFASRRIAATFIVAPPQHETIGTALKAAGERQAVVVSMPEADAIAKRVPGVESMELTRGIFGGTPPSPAEAATTVSVSWRYVAANAAAKTKVQNATRQILSVRSRVNGQAPIFLKIEAPSTDKDAVFPVHAGAAAFIDDEPDNSFDRLESLFYLIMMSSGLIGSLVAAVMSTWRHKVTGQMEPDEQLGQILLAIDQAPLRELDELERNADRQVRLFLSSRKAAEQAPMCALLVSEVRRAVEQRRKALSDDMASGDGGQPRVH
jgi:TRAP-type uncharacterized transport system substrate-binding protein